MNGTHNNEDVQPNIPFFPGRKAGVVPKSEVTATSSTSVGETSNARDEPDVPDKEKRVSCCK